MNERIKELATQADDYERKLGKGIGPTRDEKFAQLIVRECMNAVCDPRTTYLESMTESSAMYTARERIRKHFGD
jgi:tetrahydromethanopterin S-methyltransferase subunit B